MSSSNPFIIAGPCSAESYTQLEQVALSLKEQGSVNMLRAGVWKPRTRPNSFEGKGLEALDWLGSISKDHNIPVITEVANADHVEALLSRGVFNMWIGARTTVSPFSVEEIAQSLKGIDANVYIKNPIHPDIELWTGALERCWNAGLSKVSAIHRGFSSFRSSHYRNLPLWELPIELQRRFPELNIICDPSHIAGSRELIAEISQKALDLNMSGLMIEVHPSPDQALSDPQQQITPESFDQLWKQLSVKQEKVDDPHFVDQLQELRSKIDKIDEDLIQLLRSRMNIVEQIGEYKKANGVTVFQLERWNEILNSRKALGQLLGLDDNYIQQILEKIHGESIKTQINLINKEEDHHS